MDTSDSVIFDREIGYKGGKVRCEIGKYAFEKDTFGLGNGIFW